VPAEFLINVVDVGFAVTLPEVQSPLPMEAVGVPF